MRFNSKFGPNQFWMSQASVLTSKVELR